MKTPVVSVRGLTVDQLANVVYVGRRMPGRFQGHPLGNPFKPSKEPISDPRELCLSKYRRWLDALPNRDELLRQLKRDAKGKSLGCWCGAWSPGQPEIQCHAVILAKLIDALRDGPERDGI